MLVLITYDVSTASEGGARRLRRVAKACESLGQRVQESVFECLVDPSQLARLKAKLLDVMDSELDSVRIYHLGKTWENKVEHYGVKPGYNPQGPLIL